MIRRRLKAQRRGRQAAALLKHLNRKLKEMGRG